MTDPRDDGDRGTVGWIGEETVPVPEAFREQANVRDRRLWREAGEDLEAFWAEQARELRWNRVWDDVLEEDPPRFRWFPGGTLNASVNCLDRHVDAGRGDDLALVWEGEDGDVRRFTYRELLREVEHAAAGLRSLGVEPGDVVSLYVPNVPESVVAMLACARVGAPHNVIFGGFSPRNAAARMEDAGSRVLVTVDGYLRRGEVVPQKERADEAAERAGCVERVVVVERLGRDAPATPGRDVAWSDLVTSTGVGREPYAAPADHPLFLMYTSGTTGRPKGIVHGTGGYLVGVHATSRWVLDLTRQDTVWCTADVGWITGHSYQVYGPLLRGATTLLTEGAPDHPGPERPWERVERHRPTVLYTAPTTVRSLMQHGPGPVRERDLSSLRLLGSVGEPINPRAWWWLREHVGGGRCPIVDTWWQTETGMAMVAPVPGVTPLKPGSATRPLPGVEVDVVDGKGEPVEPGVEGELVVRRPWPAMLLGVHGAPERYRSTYWSRYGEGTYATGDRARVDEDGYVWVLGRLDDVVNVAGHRLSTMEVESALVHHPAVAEAAAVGAPHDVKGQVPVAFVTLLEAADPEGSLGEDLRRQVAELVGPVARPAEVHVVPELPKTRSGKILRRILSDLVRGEEPSGVRTLRNPETVEAVRRVLEDVPPEDGHL